MLESFIPVVGAADAIRAMVKFGLLAFCTFEINRVLLLGATLT